MRQILGVELVSLAIFVTMPLVSGELAPEKIKEEKRTSFSEEDKRNQKWFDRMMTILCESGNLFFIEETGECNYPWPEENKKMP